MSGREIIRDELLSRDVFTLAGADRYATAIVTALTAAGYRLIGPGEVDPVTVERCAEIARAAHISHAPGLDGYNIDIATALRALTEAKP